MKQQKNKIILVTGGSGFVGSYCILQLLTEGYHVRTTVRSLDKADDVRAMLSAGGAADLNLLSFVAADLTSDSNWKAAVEGCDYVLHVASPFPSGEPKDENELIIPAREGALRVLQAARDANVKRVVLTSSFAAIGYSIDPQDHVFTEEDWTDPNMKIPAYIKSKTLAELAAWEFIDREGGDLELTVINPVGIFGPVLGKDYSSSIRIIQQMMSGEMASIPNLSFGIVDVRDVADIHIKAMISPAAKGERFLAASDGSVTFPEIAKLLYDQHDQLSKNVPAGVLPGWVVKLAASLKEELQPVTSVKVMSNEKAKRMLNWQPRAKEAIILDTAESLIKFGLV